MISSRSLVLLGMTTLLLAACSDAREDLGLGRNTPDEFAVVERPPLSMPPDFDLRPPRPGAPRPQTIDPSEQASEALFNGNAPMPGGGSDGEKALLAQTGANRADPAIRDVVDREASQKVVASPHLVDQLMSGSDPNNGNTTVNAAAEAARIKRDQANGQPVTQGATPVIEKQESGWLGL